MRRWTLLISLLAAFITLHGQTVDGKTKLVFSCTCTDTVGIQLASAIRDSIARSPRYTLSDTADIRVTADITAHAYKLSIVSMDPQSDNPSLANLSTVLSAVVLIGSSRYVGNFVDICGRQAVDLCAEQVISMTDSAIHPQ